MANAIVVRELGGTEVLRWEAVPTPAPAAGEVLLRQTAVGVNFIDVYHRNGLYELPLPFVPGQEGAGVVEAVGAGVLDVRPGDRVAYAGLSGAYAELRVAPAARLVPLPDSIDDRTAAAVMLKGLTAEFLLRRCARVKAGDTILFHAAAGGVGSLACQWAHAMGVRVLGTAGGPDKVRRAAANGCDDVIDYTREPVVARVKELTHGEGVSTVFDSVGKDTFDLSLDCLRRRGLLVMFGQSSGLVPPFDLRLLYTKGALFLTRPSLFHYVATRDELLAGALELFAVLASGAVKPDIGQTYALRDAAQAHRDLEARRTTGSTVLMP